MKNKKFPFGEVIDQFEYDFDGIKMEVVKYVSNCGNNKVLYHCDEINQSYGSLFSLVTCWIAKKHLELSNRNFDDILISLEIKP